MNKKLMRTYIVISLILILLLIILINYRTLSELTGGFLEEQIRTWGYLGIIVFVFVLELIPQPFLSALVPFTTGLLFNLDLLYLIIITVLFGITANYVAYFIGIHYGDSVAGFFVSRKNYKKSLRWFDKYGKISITLLALTPLPYFPVMGGVFKMTPREFSIYAIIPRIFHFIIFIYLIVWVI
ncbi:hypothetical protein GF386_02090 [Candidatus Pacearchaeota archaeon]|nr:hypothetical protein [Candidatus Pacearchaeota archaeon]MBD3282958.1 hypothetical protein [Candidatus Pacearchaeota archaeon]